MSRFLVIEEERGTYRGHAHPHNGYYAGDFSSRPFGPPSFPAAAQQKAGTPLGQRLDSTQADR